MKDSVTINAAAEVNEQPLSDLNNEYIPDLLRNCTRLIIRNQYYKPFNQSFNKNHILTDGFIDFTTNT